MCARHFFAVPEVATTTKRAKPSTIWSWPEAVSGPSHQGNLLVKTNNDVRNRRTVDACSSEGLQTVNGPAMAQHVQIRRVVPACSR